MLTVNHILLIALCNVLSAAECPDECTCSNSATDCSGRKLRFIPNGISLRTTELYLNNNLIDSVEHSYQQRGRRLLDVTLLDLRYNNISFLPDEAFIHFSSLTKLFLDHNQIIFHHEHDFPFDGLERTLKVLSLSFNRITGFVSDAHISHFNRLEYFNASHNHLSVISNGSLPHSLLELDLSFNPISALISSNLEALTHLTYLDLREVLLEKFQPGVFRNVTTLKNLKIGGSHLTDLQNSAFIGLSDLTSLEIVNSTINSLPDDLFKFSPNISTLNLSYNKLSTLSPVFFSYIPNLSHLILAQNLLSDSKAIASALQLLKLQELNLEANLIQEFFSEIVNSQQDLKTLNLARNQLRTFHESLFSSSLENLDLTFNQISNVSSDAFKNCPSLRNLNLAGNRFTELPNTLETAFPLNIFIDNNIWNCTCDLYESVEIETVNSADENLIFKCAAAESLSCMFCDSPARLKGIAVQNLTSNQLTSCSKVFVPSSGLSLNVVIYVVVLVVIVAMGLACFIYIKKDSISFFLKRERFASSGSAVNRRRQNYRNGTAVRPQAYGEDVDINQQTELVALSQTCNSEQENSTNRCSTSKQSPNKCSEFCKECASVVPETLKQTFHESKSCPATEQRESLYDLQALPHAVFFLSETNDSSFSLNGNTTKHNNNNTESLKFVTISQGPLNSDTLEFNPNSSIDTYPPHNA